MKKRKLKKQKKRKLKINLDKNLGDIQELGGWDTVSYMKNEFNGKKALKLLWQEHKFRNKSKIYE